MKWFRIILAFACVGALVFYYFNPLPDFIRTIGATILPASKPEEEVRGVFTRYSDLIAHGNLRSEAIYMPEAKFLIVSNDPRGHRRAQSITAAEHRAASQQILAQIRSRQIRVRFENVECRELPGGIVRLSCTTYLNDGHPEWLSMIFIKTAPQRWAVTEETHSDF